MSQTMKQRLEKSLRDMRNKIIPTLLVVLMLVSCGTQKAGIGEGSASSSHHADPSIAFVESVIDNELTSENIVGNASVKLSMGGQNIKLSGSLRMRRDKVVRLQLMLPIIGTEVGRLEFTPDYVLVLDRMNKQYIKMNYDEVEFLSKNNISFYSLQALFWNELVPTKNTRAALSSAADYSVALTDGSTYVPVTLVDGNLKYLWQANRSDYTLSSAVITYSSEAAGTSMLTWMYSNFAAVGKKKFPYTQEFSFTTMINGVSRRAEVVIDLSDIKTSSDWDAETEISSKYKEVSVESIMSRLMR